MLLVGPTGSGKTELTKTLAQALYDDEILPRFNVSEFALPESLESALADGCGFLGRDWPALTKKCCGSICLLDELEKGALNL